jgi:2',3'-cyclic-nucleotide 2'-phosphodiesterase (5'-nucleotidase family)
MRSFTLAIAVLIAGLVVPAVAATAVPPTTTNIQLLTVSDWHGQVTPLGSGATAVGGAAALKTYFDQARAANPNTLTFMAGDSFGGTPPISSFFDDEPAVQTMNMMGISADTFGNHNFDSGLAYLQHLVDLAEFPFVSANLTNLDQNLTGVSKRALFDVGPIRVAVIGITNEEAPTLVKPGSMGTMEVTDSVAAANKTAKQARDAGAQLVVILTHKGINGRDANGNAFGELIDFADRVDPRLIDVIEGDHTDFQYSGFHHGILVVENKSKGATFAKIHLTVDRRTGVVPGSKSVSFQVPLVSGVTPDAAIQAYIDDLNAQLAPLLGTVIGSSSIAIPRADACGQSGGRTCESLEGDIVTDAQRVTYGTDFAITNSGSLRADLTCPGAGASAFCPTGITPPPFPITRGGVLGVLPFGNESDTTTLTGAEVKAFLENGVSQMPAADGRFAQVSGLCFTYDIAAPAGSRVTTMIRQAADGSCTGPAIAAGSSYTVTINDFMAEGGDGYPPVISKSTTRGLLEADVDAYIASHSPLSPSIQGRITCAGATCPVIIGPALAR